MKIRMPLYYLRILFVVLILISSLEFVQAQPITSVRPWLGVSIEKGTRGILIKSTYPDTPAEKAGLKANDEVLSIDGKTVNSPDEMIGEVTSKGVGHKVKVEFLRAGKKETKEIFLVAMPDILELTKSKLLNKPLPSIAGKLLKDGTSFNLSQIKGKKTLLKFWATWCPSCVATEPRLIEFMQKHGDKIQLITISNEEAPVLKKHFSKLYKKFPGADSLAIDLLDVENAISKEFMVSSIPLFILVDKDGVVREIEVGAGAILESLLAKAIL